VSCRIDKTAFDAGIEEFLRDFDSMYAKRVDEAAEFQTIAQRFVAKTPGNFLFLNRGEERERRGKRRRKERKKDD
jgi:hypothetical protein